MVRRFSIFFLFALTAILISAQVLQPNKVYRFKNVGKPGNVLSMSGSTQAAIGAVSNLNDLKQQWYVTESKSGNGYYFRNVSNGAYLESPLKTYTQWPVSFTTDPADATMSFLVSPYENNFTIKAATHNNAYAFAHNDGSNSIVCWLSTSTPSQWTFEEVPMTDDEIAAMLARFRQTGDEIANTPLYQSHLEALFSDKACTVLSENGDLTNNEHYLALPPVLQEMVNKVKSNEWYEADGDWLGSYAKKYRVQSYEPYSEGSAASQMAGIQAYTNMNNPTGIIANAGEILYVMVDSEIKSGATLYIGGVPDCSMYNSVTSGVPLKQGLNMIMCNADLTHYFIYYTVNAVENNKPVRKVADYEPVTIHIEGGRVNGFFNYVGDRLYTPDTKADFEYTVHKAKHPMYDLVGKYVILHFFLEDTPDLPGGTPQICVKSAFDPQLNPSAKHYDPVVTMKAWDNMCFAERILMGIQSAEDINSSFNQGMYSDIVNVPYEVEGYNGDPGFYYSDYFNNRMMGITLQAQGLYMNATAWRTAYAPSTVSAILSQFPEDGIWGPAHEYGHMNQTPMRIAGTTEESNNVFSNVANYFVCKTTSRCDYPSSQLKIFNEGKTYLENGTWGTTRMFWQLWCYYHATKHNTSFYPRLYQLLRKYPLQRDLTTIPGKLNPKKDLLHFAKMCCIAAGEDLTNFFTSWGFFVPQENYHIDDYDVYDCILTQEDIDEVKNEIKSFDFPKNDAIILIDDRPGSDLETGFGYNKALCGEYGGLKDFENGASASGEFSFTVDGNNVTVSGSGNPGVGYLIYDTDGNLIGFSNSDSFTLTNEAAQALINGEASIKAIGSDNNTVEVQDPVKSGSLDKKKELLQTLLDRCDDLLSLADETGCNIGGLIPSYCETLKEAREETADILANAGASDSDRLTEAYQDLSAEYYKLINDENARIKIEPGAAYRLINHAYTAKTIDAGDTKLVSSTFNVNSEVVPFSQQWILEPVNETSLTEFYIKNLNDGRYIGTTKKQSAEIPLGETPQSYSLITISHGVYSFAPDNEVKFAFHIDAGNKVVQWNTTSDPTQWRLVKTSTKEQISLRTELSQKVAESENLLATCGEMKRRESVEYIFPAECLYSNAPYLSANNADKFTSWNVLFDKNTATYFHSNYDNGKDSEDGLDHYIRMEAPDNGFFRFFDLSYITRKADATTTNPKSVIIEASPDNKTWREIYHASGLKTGNAVENEFGEIYAPENTRFIRFMVTAATSTAKGHPYFCLSELSVKDTGEPIFTPDEGFPYLTSEEMQNLFDEIIDARLDLAYSATSATGLQERLAQLTSAYSDIESVMIPKVDVSSVNFAVNPIVLQMGKDDFTITATVEPEDATFPEFEWIVADEEVANIVSIDGKSAVLRPVSQGVTEIAVRVVGNPLVAASAILKVLPEIPVEAVNLTPSELSVPVNITSLKIDAVIYPENASMPGLIWSVSDATVAEIDAQTGEITPQRQGVTEVYATTVDGTDITGKALLTISNPVAEGLVIYPSELLLEPGDMVQLKATYIPEEAEQPMLNWIIDNSAVATVDPSGYVTATKVGEATVTVTALINGKEIYAEAHVAVTEPALKSVSVNPINLTLNKGESADITASLIPADSSEKLVWSVSDENILKITVSADGKTSTVTALKPGMASVNVQASSNPEINAACNVTVPETAVSELRLIMDDTSFDIADGKQLVSVKVLPEEAPVPRLLWESDDNSIAKLEPVGPTECELIPLEEGKTVITVSHADIPSIYDSREIEVTESTGIARLFDDRETKVDVYDLTGKIVRLDTDLKRLNDLKPGGYIIRQGSLSKEVWIK